MISHSLFQMRPLFQADESDQPSARRGARLIEEAVLAPGQKPRLQPSGNKRRGNQRAQFSKVGQYVNPAHLLNPTNGSWWMVQVQPTREQVFS
jgi:hypothetical protein